MTSSCRDRDFIPKVENAGQVVDGVQIMHKHSDIQGHELDMLRGAARTIEQGKIHYLVISTPCLQPDCI